MFLPRKFGKSKSQEDTKRGRKSFSHLTPQIMDYGIGIIVSFLDGKMLLGECASKITIKEINVHIKLN